MIRKLKSLKYLQVLILPALAWYSFQSHGISTYFPILWMFGVIPLVELLFQPDPKNLNEEEEKSKLADGIYDLQVYLMVPIQLVMVFLFLESMQEEGLALADRIGRITALGSLCGVFGINVGHELGHRSKWYEQLMAKILLMTSLYMHFFIEHNRGHHKWVSTPEDPASARYGEPVYLFWFRSIFGVYLGAWKLENDRLRKNGQSIYSFQNEMIIYHLVQAILLVAIGYFYGMATVGYFIASAGMGYLLLETVNYIEHYGLQREKIGDRYERVMPHHSWNSDHIMGRLNLFELSRHSDHHYIASRKYQILRHMDESPQMPTGYPGMMMLSLIPPLWFSIMNPKVHQVNALKAKQVDGNLKPIVA